MVDFEKVFGEDGSGDFSLPKGSDTGVNSIYFLKGNLELQGTLTKEWTNTYAKDKYGWIEFFAGHIEMPNGQIPYVNVVANGINGQDPIIRSFLLESGRMATNRSFDSRQTYWCRLTTVFEFFLDGIMIAEEMQKCGFH
jgi:hypothetical protein